MFAVHTVKIHISAVYQWQLIQLPTETQKFQNRDTPWFDYISNRAVNFPKKCVTDNQV